MKITLPPQAAAILGRLQAAGFEAYAVGGCVRDSLLGKAPHDWDLCTAALPGEVKTCFEGIYSVIETGLAHGTVTIVADGTPYEITTYRVDGAYTDGRRPDSVTFTPSLREDLARRDFTINAMAYAEPGGLVDAFGGQADLAAGLIRCVGDAEKRFDEDALRILRALRFAAVTGFAIEEDTRAAILRLYPTLCTKAISAERITIELKKLLCGPAAGRVLAEYAPLFALLLPGAAGPDAAGPDALCAATGGASPNASCAATAAAHGMGRAAQSRQGRWQTAARMVDTAPADDAMLRLALLLCGGMQASPAPEAPLAPEAAKPKGTAALAALSGKRVDTCASAAMLLHTALRLSAAEEQAVLVLLREQDTPLPMCEDTASPARSTLLRLLHRLGKTDTRRLLAFRRAKAAAIPPEAASLDADEALLEQLLAEHACYTLKQLAVSGGDLIHLGIPPGPPLGAALERLLFAVMDGTLPNEKDALCRAAHSLLH